MYTIVSISICYSKKNVLCSNIFNFLFDDRKYYESILEPYRHYNSRN